ncbi:MAG: dimethyl sulfoxide reductase anchor subunit [Eggerthellaceae bacterium]|nr:dimethyl sulfoxide reductase anchor subunit [Eggerthellaceae bacterium]
MEIQWPLLLFSLIAGCGGATFAFVGISELLGAAEKARFKATIAAIALMIVGGLCSVAHLGQPANIMAAAQNLFSFSGISVEIIALGLAVIVALIYLIAIRGGNFGGASKALGVCGIVVGLLLGFVTGNGYVMQAQPAWNTIALPLAYLGTDLPMGAFTFLAIASLSGVDGEELKKFDTVTIACAVAAPVLCLIYGFVTQFALDPVLFWGGTIVVGALTCLFAWKRNTNANMVYGGLACAIACGVCLRAVMWLAGSGFFDLFSTAAAHSVLGI